MQSQFHSKSPLSILIVTVIMLAAMPFAGACDGGGSGTVSLDSEIDKVSYRIGLDVARNFQSMNQDINSDAVKMGIDDVLKGNTPALPDSVLQQAMMSFQQRMMQEQQQQRQASMQENLDEAQAFLAENAERDGVVLLADSLEYMVLEEGNGPKPGPEDSVQVHYHGTFLDGNVFDSSVERGEPFSFTVNQVIPGWTRILQEMPVGSKWKVWIPPHLAYGERGTQGIEPNKMLVFEIELIDIMK